MLSWIDSHVHWDAPEFAADRGEALSRAKQAGVVCCLLPAVEVASFADVQTLAEAAHARPDWPVLLAAYGIHPLYIDRTQAEDLATLDAQLKAHRPAAIGEIGLDAYTGGATPPPDFSRQQHFFEAQLALAVEHQLPVILHSRHAVEAVILSLKRVQGGRQKIPGGIAHAFNGSQSQAEQLIKLGFLLGFGGSLTYDGSKRIRRLAASLPLETIVLETDAPDMSPAWLQRQRNEPAQLPRIAQALAVLRGEPLARLAAQAAANLQRLFPATSAALAGVRQAEVSSGKSG